MKLFKIILVYVNIVPKLMLYISSICLKSINHFHCFFSWNKERQVVIFFGQGSKKVDSLQQPGNKGDPFISKSLETKPKACNPTSPLLYL